MKFNSQEDLIDWIYKNLDGKDINAINKVYTTLLENDVPIINVGFNKTFFTAEINEDDYLNATAFLSDQPLKNDRMKFLSELIKSAINIKKLLDKPLDENKKIIKVDCDVLKTDLINNYYLPMPSEHVHICINVLYPEKKNDNLKRFWNIMVELSFPAFFKAYFNKNLVTLGWNKSDLLSMAVFSE